MPLPGAGAVAPKGDSNSWGRPHPWPVPNTFLLRCAICALSNVAMGLSGKTIPPGSFILVSQTRVHLQSTRMDTRRWQRS